MKRVTLLSGLAMALVVGAPLLTSAGAAPLPPVAVSASAVELVAAKGPGKCGTHMFWSKKNRKCEDARTKSKG